jgi:hypothetical protein
MLIAIRTEFERSLANALPGWKRFSARVQRISEGDLPCVNMFFHKDRLLEEGNGLETRQIMVEIEAGFVVKSDAEKELSELRQVLEHAIESNTELSRRVLNLSFINVDFAHDMAGAQRVAVLMISARMDYERGRPAPPIPAIGPVLNPTINGEAVNG